MPFDVDKFVSVLPPPVRRFAPLIAEHSNALITPFEVYGLGSRETLWGRSRAYKQNTGDWAPRAWTRERVEQFPAVHVVGEKGGKLLVMPNDGLGWGRGLLQLDFVAEYEWLQKNDWRDPAVNIPKGVEHLMSKFAFMNSTEPVTGITDGKKITVSGYFAKRWGVPDGVYPDPRPLIGGVLLSASIAAYNAARENVLRAIAAAGVGAIDLCTTPGRRNGPGDYSKDVRIRADKLKIRYRAA